MQGITEAPMGYCVLDRTVGSDALIEGTVSLRLLLWKAGRIPPVKERF